MVFTIRSSALSGISGIGVRVETDVSAGLPSFQIVGLGDTAVQESRERVRSAIRNSGFSFPAKRITVNLSPADVRKSGPAFDLAVALTIVAEEAGIEESAFADTVVLGELALDGNLREIEASVAHAASARECGIKTLLLPSANAPEASKVPDIRTVGVRSLAHAVGVLRGTESPASDPPHRKSARPTDAPDFREILGQDRAKRALEIAAAWGHNLLLEGAPGSGKTLLCRAFPGILPTPDFDELLEIARIRSIVSKSRGEGAFLGNRPFRAVHPTASVPSLVGGGPLARPGEISLAHLWVLFLDEIREFPIKSLESLRQPLEDGEIQISRANAHVTYLSRFQLLATANPCPCGYLGDREKECSCPSGSVDRYRSKLSGPILDRIDLFVAVPRLSAEELSKKSPSETTEVIKARVEYARNTQKMRFSDVRRTNATLTNRELDIHLRATPDAERLLLSSVDRLGLSSRAYFRIKKVARTIADLARSETVTDEHVAEAVGYRER